MTMWEVLSFADKPYKGLTKAKVVMVMLTMVAIMVDVKVMLLAMNMLNIFETVTMSEVLSFADKPYGHIRD